MSPEATYVLESLATVTVFAGALYLATVGLRRIGATSTAGGPLEILARRPLDARRAIYLVRVGRRVLVVGASDGGLTRLGSTSLDSVRAELAEEATAPRGFSAVLGRVLARPSKVGKKDDAGEPGDA